LAFLAPDADVEHFVTLAAGIISVELDNHRRLSAGFDCDFDNIVPGPELAQYMDFLMATSADMGEALVSMMPCVTGYGVALRALSPDNAGDYSGWVAAYTSGAYQDVIDRHCRLVDHFNIDYDRAITLIDRALDLEDAFWNQLPPTQGTTK
jgi:thiaminase